MTDDILAELRAFREEFARSHGYDLGAMAAALRAMDLAAGGRVVRREPRSPVGGGGKADESNRASPLPGTTGTASADELCR
jgi:hypothetical protein